MCASAVNVYLPKDRVTNMHQQYGFVEYRGEEDADYVSRPVRNLASALLVGCLKPTVSLSTSCSGVHSRSSHAGQVLCTTHGCHGF